MSDLTNLEVVVSCGVPESARVLLWEVFFASRDRGVNLRAHFPWLENDQGVFCVAIHSASTGQKKQCLATLVIKQIRIKDQQKIGLIGLVSVDEKWRGHGLSSKLMTEAISFAERLGFDALVLWTQKPRVYAGHGFDVDAQDMFGYVHPVPAHYPHTNFLVEAWPDSESIAMLRGLPPFAKSGSMISNDLARVVILDSGNGITLAEWRGFDHDVADLLQCALSGRWSLNVAQGDGLILELLSRNFHVDLKPTSVRMVKKIKELSLSELPFIEFLDRV